MSDVPPDFSAQDFNPQDFPVGYQPSAALQNLFNSIVEDSTTQWGYVDLYQITLLTGEILYLTTADFDVSYYGNIYASGGVGVDQAESKVQAHWKVGFDTDTWTVVFSPRTVDPVTGEAFPDMVGDIPWIQAAHSGYFDDADFQVSRAYFSPMPTWPMPPTGAVPLGVKTIFAGVVGQIDATDSVVVFTVNDYRSLLSISMPRHFYQAQCRHTLFDAGCGASGLARPAFAVSGVAQAGSTQSNIVTSGLSNPPGSGTYALGTIVFTSGLNEGFQATVAGWDGINLSLVTPLPFPVELGDEFSAAAGCDLQLVTCIKFNNSANFGGFPFIPAPEVSGT